jgi:cytochrome c
MKNFLSLALSGALFLAFAGLNPAQAAVDTKQAEGLVKSNKCSKCHHATKTKTGPSWTKIAADLKGKPDAEAEIIKNITTGPLVEFKDGTKEEHKIIKTKDQLQLKNLAQWILAH